MTIQISTHGDVLRHTGKRVVVAAGLTIVMTAASLVLCLGSDFSATVTVGYVAGFDLCIATVISASLSAALSYRSALLMKELSLTRSELARISQTDQLTSLFNRRGFDEAAALALTSARKLGVPVSVFLCDIDHFKSINDRFGHETGDKVLVEVADVLRQLAQKEGVLVARYGGEEFAGLLVGATRDQAEQYAEALRTACAAREIPIGETIERVTVSLGFTVSCADAELAELMRIADRALYAAKRRGRDRVVEADARVAA
ncbi:GGDEF domain-containing protein [Bradyrhizobium sp. CB1650]|uniref:GGDEF domain-containing protein n=1 Tax=Bradyrhizobium sp. CB1650 TaxID=3039153 RepID=UPI002434DD1D|nr:GGDEF domain-containing protein [Bradyrhizobium sp. CB1650]WGD52629.1 GGDEF domain-containing protein [Bradyrhizobium sp. CB1650]